MLGRTFSGVPLEVMKQIASQKHKKLSKKSNLPELRAFAHTLQFYCMLNFISMFGRISNWLSSSTEAEIQLPLKRLSSFQMPTSLPYSELVGVEGHLAPQN